MNDNSEAHNLGQILRLLHLAPVTFRPGLPYVKISRPTVLDMKFWMKEDDDLHTNHLFNLEFIQIHSPKAQNLCKCLLLLESQFKLLIFNVFLTSL